MFYGVNELCVTYTPIATVSFAEVPPTFSISKAVLFILSCKLIDNNGTVIETGSKY